MTRYAGILLVAGACLSAACSPSPDTPTVPVLVAPRASTPPVIDGQPDDAAWLSAPWSRPFRDIRDTLGTHPHPPLSTRMKVVWDASYLYALFEVEEPHVASVLPPENPIVWHDQDIEWFLDPDGTGQDYLEVEGNADNRTLVLTLDRPYHAGGSWTPCSCPDVRYAAAVTGTLNNPSDTDTGWHAEIAIPRIRLDALHRDGRHGRILFMNASRVHWPLDVVGSGYVKRAGESEDNWVWSPTGIVDIHRPLDWGVLYLADTPWTLIPGVLRDVLAQRRLRAGMVDDVGAGYVDVPVAPDLK